MRPLKRAGALGGDLAVVTAMAVARAQAQHAVVLCGGGTDREEVVSRVASHLRSPHVWLIAGGALDEAAFGSLGVACMS